MPGQTIQVLLVEDNPDDRELTCLALSKATGYHFDILPASDLKSAIEVLRSENPNVILLDLGLPDSDGFNGLATIRRERDNVPIIIVTGNEDEEIALRSLDHGAQDYLVKPIGSTETLGRSIRYAIQRQQLLRQVTRTKKLLEGKNRRLAKLYRTAHRFVDNVSHEFRTPLTVIKEYSALLREGIVGDVDAEQTRLLDVIGDRADDLNTIVDDMLDSSKLDSGLLGTCRKKHRVIELIDHVLPALERKATIQGINFQIDVDDNLPEVFCDAEKVGRIIINLVVNAIKYCSDPGCVRLWSRRDTTSGGAIIGVTDNGRGIDHDSFLTVFKRFKQLATNGHRSTKGFGLGLNIAKELVELNFGHLTVESELGQGSTFSFDLPPAEPTEVMQRYIRRIIALRNGDTALSLVKATIDQTTVSSDMCDDMDALLTYVLRGNDLLLRLAADNWLIVLPTEEPEVEKFMARVRQTLHDTNRNRPTGELPEIMLQPFGSWHIADDKEELMDRITLAFVPFGGNSCLAF